MYKNAISIGRDPQCDISIDGRYDTVSNNHGTIEYNGEGLVFIDHSANGTIINNQRVKNMQVNIYQGDEILLAGSYHLDWDEINRYFPRMGRPTVTRNIHGEQPGQWQNGPMKTQPLGGRTTDLYNDPISHKYGPDFYSSKWQSRSEADRQNEIQGEIGRWNWGAFFFGWIWGAGHKYWMPLLWIIVANFVINLLTLFTGSMGFSLFLSYVVWFGVSTYLGINGSRIAWDKGCYTDIEHFRMKEHNWLIGGIIFFTVVLIINLIFIASLL